MRHRAGKHKNQKEGLQQVQQLSSSVLVEIVGHAVRNVKENKVFAESLRIERSNYSQLKEDKNEFSESSGLSKNAATLMATKVAHCLLAYSKQQKHFY